jgi:hypothetical protein
LELRKERQGQRIKAAALNEKPNGSIRGSRLLQQNRHEADQAVADQRLLLRDERTSIIR